MFGGWLLSAACVLQFRQDRVYCTVIFALLSCGTLMLSVVCFVKRSRQSGSTSMLSGLMVLTSGVTLVVSTVTTYDPLIVIDDVWLMILGVLQSLFAFANSVSLLALVIGHRLHGKNKLLVELMWKGGPHCAGLSLSARFQELRRMVNLSRRQRRRKLREINIGQNLLLLPGVCSTTREAKAIEKRFEDELKVNGLWLLNDVLDGDILGLDGEAFRASSSASSFSVGSTEGTDSAESTLETEGSEETSDGNTLDEEYERFFQRAAENQTAAADTCEESLLLTNLDAASGRTV